MASKTSSQGVWPLSLAPSGVATASPTPQPPQLCWRSQIEFLKWAVVRGHCCFGKNVSISTRRRKSNELMSRCQGMPARKDRTLRGSSLSPFPVTSASAFLLTSYGRRLNNASKEDYVLYQKSDVLCAWRERTVQRQRCPQQGGRAGRGPLASPAPLCLFISAFEQIKACPEHGCCFMCCG